MPKSLPRRNAANRKNRRFPERFGGNWPECPVRSWNDAETPEPFRQVSAIDRTRPISDHADCEPRQIGSDRSDWEGRRCRLEEGVRNGSTIGAGARSPCPARPRTLGPMSPRSPCRSRPRPPRQALPRARMPQGRFRGSRTKSRSRHRRKRSPRCRRCRASSKAAAGADNGMLGASITADTPDAAQSLARSPASPSDTSIAALA